MIVSKKIIFSALIPKERILFKSILFKILLNPFSFLHKFENKILSYKNILFKISFDVKISGFSLNFIISFIILFIILLSIIISIIEGLKLQN